MAVLNNTGMSSGDDYADGNVWFRITHVNYEADAKDDSPLGYKQKSTGFGFGVDQQLNEKFNLGLSYNYVKSNLNGKDGYMLEDDIKSHAFGVYATMMHEGMFADAQFNYIKNKVDGKRTVGGGDAVAPVTYKYDGSVFNTVIGVGMDVGLDNDWYAKPKVCLAFSNYKNDEFNESGGLVAAQKVNQASYTSVELGMQFVVGADMMMDNCKVQPKMKLGFMYDLNDKGDKVTYNFVGKDMSVEGAKRDRSNFNVGAGVGVVLDQVTMDFGYDFRWSSNSKAHGFVAKLGYMF